MNCKHDGLRCEHEGKKALHWLLPYLGVTGKCLTVLGNGGLLLLPLLLLCLCCSLLFGLQHLPHKPEHTRQPFKVHHLRLAKRRLLLIVRRSPQRVIHQSSFHLLQCVDLNNSVNAMYTKASVTTVHTYVGILSMQNSLHCQFNAPACLQSSMPSTVMEYKL